MKQENKFTYMTQTPVPKLVGTLAVPTIISMLVSSFYNMADTFFVGKINTQATAAVGVVFSLMTLIQAFGFLFGHGSGNYISRKLGAKQYEDASVMAATGFYLALLCGLLIMLGGLVFLEPLAYWLGSTETILPYTKEYLKYILIGAPYMAASLVLNNQLRFQGNAVYSMVGIVVGAVLNIALDPLFIFVFDMGIAGAALATIISQFVSFVILVVMSNRGGNIRIRIRNVKIKLYYIKEIIKGGIPSLFRQGLASVATIFLNQVAGGYNDAAIAAMSVVTRIAMFANSVLIGFGQGFQPVCAFNYGAGLYRRVREAFWFCIKTSTIFLAALSVLGAVFAPNLISIFIKEDLDVIQIGTLAIRLQCITFPLGSWIILCNMMLQAIGKSIKASIVAAARQGLFFLPIILILPNLWGLLGIQLAQPIADVCTLLLSLPLGISVLKDMKNAEEIS